MACNQGGRNEPRQDSAVYTIACVEKERQAGGLLNKAAKGRRAEHEFRSYAEGLGWWVIRAAGSKGRADVVALPRQRARHIVFASQSWSGCPGVPVLVDLKTTGWAGREEQAELERLAKDACCYALLVSRVAGKLAGLSPRWRFRWVVHPVPLPKHHSDGEESN